MGEVDRALAHRDRGIVKPLRCDDCLRADALPVAKGICQMATFAPGMLRDRVAAALHLEHNFFAGQRGHGDMRYTVALEPNKIALAKLCNFRPCDRGGWPD